MDQNNRQMSQGSISTAPYLDGPESLARLLSPKLMPLSEISDKELNQRLDELLEEKNRRETLKYFLNALDSVLGESEDLNGLKSKLKSALNDREIQLLKDFVQTVDIHPLEGSV